mgnify:CR=1 FL=1
MGNWITLRMPGRHLWISDMTKNIKALVITGYGTNCEMEMAHACRLAGSDEVDIVYIHEILNGEKRLDDYHFLNLPGGFLDGDDLGSAKAGANRIVHAKIKGSGEPLRDQFLRFIHEGKLILGVCNGFQLLVKLGMLPGLDRTYDRQTVTLAFPGISLGGWIIGWRAMTCSTLRGPSRASRRARASRKVITPPS